MIPRWHLIEGEAGCAYAREHECVAIIVDALRASATAAMLIDAGATEIWVVRDVDDAFRAREACPGALLYGERRGLPPAGFDHGNSPRDAVHAAGRPVIFTTTNGALRLVQAWGAPVLYIGSTTNALAVAMAARAHDREVVLIPAGSAEDPDHVTQEDWVAATVIAQIAEAPIGEGAPQFREWRHLMELDGIPKLFETAAHAATLRGIGLGEDVALCARVNTTSAVPAAVTKNRFGVILRSDMEN